MIRPTFRLPDRLHVEKSIWPNRWHVEPIFGVDLHPLYDGSGRKDLYPDGIARTPEEAKAIADELAKRWNAYERLLTALKATDPALATSIEQSI